MVAVEFLDVLHSIHLNSKLTTCSRRSGFRKLNWPLPQQPPPKIYRFPGHRNSAGGELLAAPGRCEQRPSSGALTKI